MCMICKFAYRCHIGLLKSYRYFMTYRDMIPLHPYKKRSYRKHTENIRKHTKNIQKCAPYGNCTEILQKIYSKCAKICNNSNNEPVSTNELLQNLAHFLYSFCTISVQFPYGAHFLYVICMVT